MKEYINKLELEIQSLRKKLAVDNTYPTYKDWEKALEEKHLDAYLQAMSAYFCLKFDVPPGNIVLKTKITDEGKGIDYWFERKETTSDEDAFSFPIV